MTPRRRLYTTSLRPVPSSKMVRSGAAPPRACPARRSPLATTGRPVPAPTRASADGAAAPSQQRYSRLPAGLVPVSWTPNERRIRCQRWTRARGRSGRGGTSRMTSRPGQSGWSWTRARRSARWRDLDLTESALRGWVDRARADRGQGRPGVLATAEREELTRLRTEVRELRIERAILVKAAALCAKENA